MFPSCLVFCCTRPVDAPCLVYEVDTSLTDFGMYLACYACFHLEMTFLRDMGFNFYTCIYSYIYVHIFEGSQCQHQ